MVTGRRKAEGGYGGVWRLGGRSRKGTIEKGYAVCINKAIKDVRAAKLLSENVKRYSRYFVTEPMKERGVMMVRRCRWCFDGTTLPVNLV